jgi:AraC-like DNA-binding protein
LSTLKPETWSTPKKSTHDTSRGMPSLIHRSTVASQGPSVMGMRSASRCSNMRMNRSRVLIVVVGIHYPPGGHARSRHGTPAEFVIRARIQRAQTLLAFSGHSVKQIADMLGYADAFCFSHQFTARTGTSPSAFRSSAPRSRRLRPRT